MDPQIQIGREIKRLDNEIHSSLITFQAQNGGDGITMMQAWIIGYLYRSRGREVFQKDIEAEFSIARSTATGILQLMEKKGYIERCSVERDARLKRLVLTMKGVQLEENTIRHFKRMEELLRQGIPEEDLDVFLRVVRQMRLNLEKDHSETDRRRDRC